MTLPTASALPLDQVYTRFSHNKVGGREYKDQKYKKRPLLQLLTSSSKDGKGGGKKIVHPINLGTASNGQSLGRNEEFSIEGDSNETWAVYDWRTVIETVFVSWWDLREADGNLYKMLKILDSRVDETRENMEDNILTMLCATSKAATNDIDFLTAAIKSTGAFGGLNPSTSGQSVWASEVEDTINWSVEGIGRTREGVNKVEDNKGDIDVIVLPDQYFNETCEIGDSAVVLNQDLKTRGGTKYADLGTKVPLILNTPVMRDPKWNAANANTGIGIDTMGTHLVVDPNWDMFMWPFKEMVWHGRLGQASVQIKVCELTQSSRRTNLLLSTIA